MSEEEVYQKALQSILQIEFREVLRSLMHEEFQSMMKEFSKSQQLPPLLTITELMELLHIGRTKASELLARPGFPVCREVGVLIPRDRLFQWIDRHTQWVEEDTDFYKNRL